MLQWLPPAECRVLVVEDNQDVADSTAAVLRAHGFPVRVEYEGAGGLAASREFAPHVAFLDIGLPDISGFDLARSLRAMFGRSLYLVAVTAWGSPEDKQRAYESGFDVHCTKPAELNSLVELALGRCISEASVQSGKSSE